LPTEDEDEFQLNQNIRAIEQQQQQHHQHNQQASPAAMSTSTSALNDSRMLNTSFFDDSPALGLGTSGMNFAQQRINGPSTAATAAAGGYDSDNLMGDNRIAGDAIGSASIDTYDDEDEAQELRMVIKHIKVSNKKYR
jgi:hypothetical protein